MNERLTKLAQQANIEFTYDPTETPVRAFVECWEDELEKFTELIVKECASFIDSHEQVDKYGEAMDIVYGKDLLKHFGVEE